ncbi:MAG: pantoate--beta-alanine ligase [Desulfurivibrionaceae bacterium]|nr:pantoate--beta-alanine ligase [Desulfobulbales bacterium]MDT8334798.1 pantoate--beta-alanine ligase [Desulfurivibrionaceae bacterium]
MEIIKSPDRMSAWAEARIRAGKRISLVPTMGFFHEGHLCLMRRAAQTADLVVVSLFVNPIQFGPGEDLDRYPRDMERDAGLAWKEGVAVLFAPAREAMYPELPQTRVTVAGLSEGLCGLTRPGHFDGVCTVVAKLFNIVKPATAVFGSKDYQQLAVIRKMTADLNWNIDIVAHPIVRDHNGLAMSSRNSYLSAEERRSALALVKAIDVARAMTGRGINDADRLLAELEIIIKMHDNVEIEYLTIVDSRNLQVQKNVDNQSLLAMAIRVGGTRLIDNAMLFEEAGEFQC